MSNYEAIQKLKDAIKKLEEEDRLNQQITTIVHDHGTIYLRSENGDCISSGKESSSSSKIFQAKLANKVTLDIEKSGRQLDVVCSIRELLDKGYELTHADYDARLIFEKC